MITNKEDKEMEELVELSDSDTWAGFDPLIDITEDNSKITNPITTKISLGFKLAVLIFIITVLILNHFYCVAIVSGRSMEPTYYDNTWLIASRNTDHLNRFDIVLVKQDNMIIIKRIIGLPGETITYKDNNLYIDGNYIKDSYGSGITDDFTSTIKEGEYYCLGDNREISKDSRCFGAFKKEKIFGKVKE